MTDQATSISSALDCASLMLLQMISAACSRSALDAAAHHWAKH